LPLKWLGAKRDQHDAVHITGACLYPMCL